MTDSNDRLELAEHAIVNAYIELEQAEAKRDTLRMRDLDEAYAG